MLPSCNDYSPLRIMGIDPGTDTLGVSVLDAFLHSNTICLVYSTTFHGSQMANQYRYLANVHGDKVARLKAHEDNLYYLLSLYQPHEVISEAPYMGRFPAAYGALVQCMDSIRAAVIRYDAALPLLTADPPTVKNAVGVGGRNGDKTMMASSIAQMILNNTILNPNGLNIALLDEHSIDSIAVAYVRARHAISTNVYRTHAPN